MKVLQLMTNPVTSSLTVDEGASFDLDVPARVSQFQNPGDCYISNGDGALAGGRTHLHYDAVKTQVDEARRRFNEDPDTPQAWGEYMIHLYMLALFQQEHAYFADSADTLERMHLLTASDTSCPINLIMQVRQTLPRLCKAALLTLSREQCWPEMVMVLSILHELMPEEENIKEGLAGALIQESEEIIKEIEDYPQALDCVREAHSLLANNRTRAALRDLLVRSLFNAYKGKKYANVKADLEEAVELNLDFRKYAPVITSISIEIAQAATDDEERKEAIEILDAAHKLSPDDEELKAILAVALHDYAGFLNGARRFDEALEAVRKSHDLLPIDDIKAGLAAILVNAATGGIRRDHFEEDIIPALAKCREAFQVCPENHPVRQQVRHGFVTLLELIATERIAIGEYENAVAPLLEAVKEDPDNQEIEDLLRIVSARQRDSNDPNNSN